MSKLVLARGDITATDELVIVLSEPDNEPAAVLIHWPQAASVASPAAFPTLRARSLRSSPAPPYGSHNTRRGGCRSKDQEPLARPERWPQGFLFCHARLKQTGGQRVSTATDGRSCPNLDGYLPQSTLMGIRWSKFLLQGEEATASRLALFIFREIM
jgi:hypothetical protein